MPLKVVFSDEAKADLTAIFVYVSFDSERAAAWLADKLEAAAMELSDGALHYPELERHPGIRRRAVSSYNLFYRIKADSVEVLHIVHGARDIERLFPDD